MTHRIGHKEDQETVLLLVAVPSSHKIGSLHPRSIGSYLANPRVNFFLTDTAVYPKNDQVARDFCASVVYGYERTMIDNDEFYPGIGTTDIYTEDDFNGVLNFSTPHGGWERQIVLIAGSKKFEKKIGICVLPMGTEMVRVIDDLVSRHRDVEISANPVAMRREPEKRWVVKLIFERNDGFEDTSMWLKSITAIPTRP